MLGQMGSSPGGLPAAAQLVNVAKKLLGQEWCTLINLVATEPWNTEVITARDLALLALMVQTEAKMLKNSVRALGHPPLNVFECSSSNALGHSLQLQTLSRHAPCRSEDGSTSQGPPSLPPLPHSLPPQARPHDTKIHRRMRLFAHHMQAMWRSVPERRLPGNVPNMLSVQCSEVLERLYVSSLRWAGASAPRVLQRSI